MTSVGGVLLDCFLVQFTPSFGTNGLGGCLFTIAILVFFCYCPCSLREGTKTHEVWSFLRWPVTRMDLFLLTSLGLLSFIELLAYGCCRTKICTIINKQSFKYRILLRILSMVDFWRYWNNVLSEVNNLKRNKKVNYSRQAKWTINYFLKCSIYTIKTRVLKFSALDKLQCNLFGNCGIKTLRNPFGRIFDIILKIHRQNTRLFIEIDLLSIILWWRLLIYRISILWQASVENNISVNYSSQDIRGTGAGRGPEGGDRIQRLDVQRGATGALEGGGGGGAA